MSVKSLVFKNYHGVSHTINVTDIVYFEAEHKYLTVKTSDGKSWVIDGTLKGMLEDIGDSFIRIHRRYLVNKAKVIHIVKLHATQWEVVTKDIPARLSISRRRLDDVLNKTKKCYNIPT